MSVRIINGDCLDELKKLADNSVDSCVTDPPYGLKFMGKAWDHGIPGVPYWVEVLRVLKPGAYLLAFGGTRTYHRLACAIEDAGFEIRDQIGWAFGSGFPKSLDVSKAIDKEAGAKREVIGNTGRDPNRMIKFKEQDGCKRAPTNEDITAPATDAAKQWQGWGTALKPAWEPIVMARKPLGAPELNVQKVVESGLRERGVIGEIRWSKNALPAGNRKGKSNSGSGAPLPARTVAASATVSTEQPTANFIERGGTNGRPIIQADSANSADKGTPDFGDKLSTPTAENAPVAESGSFASSPSITSTAAAPRTAGQPMARSTPNYAASDSPQGIVSFAGIATGLTGSMGSVHIRQLQDGSFEWPDDLPKFIPSKPLTVAANVQQYGTGGLNIDGCRIESGGEHMRGEIKSRNEGTWSASKGMHTPGRGFVATDSPLGRWPANLIHDGSDEVLACFPQTASGTGAVKRASGAGYSPSAFGKESRAAGTPNIEYGDAGNAARFFYCPKADRADRNEGLQGMGTKPLNWSSGEQSPGTFQSANTNRQAQNLHPTVKPTDLMRYLCRLVTPKGGTVLDPFMGSGSTGRGAIREGFNFIGIEIDAEYCAIAHKRIHADAPLFAEVA